MFDMPPSKICLLTKKISCYFIASYLKEKAVSQDHHDLRKQLENNN